MLPPAMAEWSAIIMLQNLSEQVRECLRRAEECAQQAKHQCDPKLAGDYLDLERRWLKPFERQLLPPGRSHCHAFAHSSAFICIKFCVSSKMCFVSSAIISTRRLPQS